jgi:hypothetical protein
MKKRRLLFAAVLLIGSLLSGCSAIEDATDITFTIDRSTVFTVTENALTTTAYNLDLNDSEDYRKYKGKIKQVEIDYVRYSIATNTGGGGQAELYANVLGGPFGTATKVAGPISFAAGETRGAADVAWLNKVYFENLLASGQLSVWVVAAGTNVNLTLPVSIRVRITANPL